MGDNGREKEDVVGKVRRQLEVVDERLLFELGGGSGPLLYWQGFDQEGLTAGKQNEEEGESCRPLEPFESTDGGLSEIGGKPPFFGMVYYVGGTGLDFDPSP